MKMQAGRFAGLAAVGLMVVGLAACGDDGDSDDGGTDGEAVEEEAADGDEGSEDGAGESDDSAPDETTTTTLDPEEEVLAAYERANEALEVAFAESDPEHPELLATHSGDPLRGAQEGIRARQDLGLGIVGERIGSPEVVSLDAHRAVIHDCWSEELQEIDLATGDDVGASFVEGDFTEYEMELMQGDWVVVSTTSMNEECG